MSHKTHEPIFATELEVLQQAKSVLSQEGMEPERYAEAYGKLVSDYEKLLKTTVKLSRISDIQGRMLKEREMEVKAANDSLSQLEDQRKKLMSDISHELGTPMTSIQGYVKAMIDGVVPPNKDYLQMIYGKIKFVNRLVSDLYQLSRLESNKIQFHFMQVTPEELLRPYAGKFAVDAAKAGIRLEVAPLRNDPERKRWVAHADPYRIEQVMTNLVHNAIKFTPAGGSITINAEVEAGVEGTGDPARPHRLAVRVIDTGIGVREEDAPHLFERFYRANRQEKASGVSGTGLGLAISKEIILQHQGTIGVTSTPGEGSTFYFTLPLHA
jgi:signal transduction histidine kinase